MTTNFCLRRVQRPVSLYETLLSVCKSKPGLDRYQASSFLAVLPPSVSVRLAIAAEDVDDKLAQSFLYGLIAITSFHPPFSEDNICNHLMILQAKISRSYIVSSSTFAW